MKQQCMHCVDPACASACMMGSFQKRDNGIVTWMPDKCIGCRYCQVACPFEIPKFEWDSPLPRMVKCQNVPRQGRKHGSRPATGRQEPACCEVCPREAVIYGDYDDLKAEAQARLDANPDRYNPRVYGLDDIGGTQVLYLTPDGRRVLRPRASGIRPGLRSALPVGLQHTIYKGFIAPVAVYAVLAGLVVEIAPAGRQGR